MHGVYKLHTISSVQRTDPLLLGARLTLSEETFLALTTAAFLLLLCWCPPPSLCVALSLSLSSSSLSPLLLLLSDALMSL